MTVPEHILDKLQKLKAMAEHKTSNEHEAAVAAAKMQQLLFEYNLSIADLDEPEAKEEFINEVVDLPHATRFTSTWHRALVNVIAEHNFCRAVAEAQTVAAKGRRFTERGKKVRMHVVGQPHNVKIVVFMYTFLEREIARLASEAVRRHCDLPTPGERGSWVNAFCQGAVAVIYTRLREQRKVDVQKEGGVALVRATEALVKRAFDHFHPPDRLRDAYSSEPDAEAFGRGVKAGRDIPLSQAMEQKARPPVSGVLGS